MSARTSARVRAVAVAIVSARYYETTIADRGDRRLAHEAPDEFLRFVSVPCLWLATTCGERRRHHLALERVRVEGGCENYDREAAYTVRATHRPGSRVLGWRVKTLFPKTQHPPAGLKTLRLSFRHESRLKTQSPPATSIFWGSRRPVVFCQQMFDTKKSLFFVPASKVKTLRLKGWESRL